MRVAILGFLVACCHSDVFICDMDDVFFCDVSLVTWSIHVRIRVEVMKVFMDDVTALME